MIDTSNLSKFPRKIRKSQEMLRKSLVSNLQKFPIKKFPMKIIEEENSNKNGIAKNET